MAEQTSQDHRPTLVVDFDGTVYRDDGPVRFYAEHAAATLPAGPRARMLKKFEAYLAEGMASAAGADDEAEAAVLASSVDAWGAAAGLGALNGVDNAALEDAFQASRKFMLMPQCAVAAVPALVEAFEQLRSSVRIVLATNSPAAGLAPLLDRLGVTALFDEVVSGANKPQGLRRWIADQLAERSPGELFSLGDHYFNEIEPAMAVGASAGYIDRFRRADGPATVTAETVEDLLPGVFAWVRTVVGS